jgi:hypothetical protein
MRITILILKLYITYTEFSIHVENYIILGIYIDIIYI